MTDKDLIEYRKLKLEPEERNEMNSVKNIYLIYKYLSFLLFSRILFPPK